MTDDDAIDLSAWQAPPPAADLADAVIARLRDATTVGAALPLDEPPRAHRRWWPPVVLAAASAAAGVVATLAVVVVDRDRGAREVEPARGELVAAAARRVDLDGASAELDPDTAIAWRRDGDTLVVAQSRGAATWRAERAMRIETGAAGAPIEAAAGASLRVEARVNATDVRVIGASAATAAAVALVSVVVYEGYVRGNEGGRLLTIAPGTTMAWPPPPVAPSPVVVPPTPAPGPPAVLAPAGPSLDELDTTMREHAHAFRACYQRGVAKNPRLGGKLVVAFDVDGGGHVHGAGATAKLGTWDSTVLACIGDAVGKLEFAAHGGLAHVEYPFVFASTTPAVKDFDFTASPSCDAAKLAGKGRDELKAARYSEALVDLEQAFACADDHDPALDALAFVAACHAGDRDAARAYYPKVMPAQRLQLAGVCIRNHIDLEELSTIAWRPPANMDCRPESYAHGLPRECRPPMAMGHLRVISKPVARIVVDGAQTDATTPVTLDVAPGKHKITFVIGDDRFTYTVTVGTGELVTLAKDFQ